MLQEIDCPLCPQDPKALPNFFSGNLTELCSNHLEEGKILLAKYEASGINILTTFLSDLLVEHFPAITIRYPLTFNGKSFIFVYQEKIIPIDIILVARALDGGKESNQNLHNTIIKALNNIDKLR